MYRFSSGSHCVCGKTDPVVLIVVLRFQFAFCRSERDNCMQSVTPRHEEIFRLWPRTSGSDIKINRFSICLAPFYFLQRRYTVRRETLSFFGTFVMCLHHAALRTKAIYKVDYRVAGGASLPSEFHKRVSISHRIHSIDNLTIRLSDVRSQKLCIDCRYNTAAAILSCFFRETSHDRLIIYVSIISLYVVWRKKRTDVRFVCGRTGRLQNAIFYFGNNDDIKIWRIRIWY